MFGTLRKSTGHLAELDRVKAVTRRHFRLPEEAAILVAELACTQPGCPPLETVVAFWTSDGTRHHVKVFKPAAEVGEDDLPAPWLMGALVVPAGFVDECC
jgi:hypothetical protein